MVNVGSTPAIEQRQKLGYPICAVCGQSVSPLASDRQLEVFREGHKERCGREPDMLGFFADVVADSLALPACAGHTEAYSVLEAMRIAAAHALDMHMEDLQVLVIGHVDRDEVDGVLWDPMPGGSGLLDQMRDNFGRIVSVAKDLLEKCPSACEHSCIDCLQTFRNGFYHKHLDRHVALERLKEWGETLRETNDIPPSQPTSHVPNLTSQPVNDAETKLKHLLEAAGFTAGQFQQQVQFRQPLTLDRQIGSTTPDVSFAGDEDDPDDKGVCVYLDGMSAGLHGNSETAARDREIRTWLRNNGYHVIEIPANELDDRDAMIRHFRKLARYLQGRDLAETIAQQPDWFDRAKSTEPRP